MAIFEFGGFTSDSEFPEDASSFSTLPTSQFALKPSSSDIDSSQEEKMDYSPPPSMTHSLMDRNGGAHHQTGLHDLRTVLTSKTALFGDRSKNDGSSAGGTVGVLGSTKSNFSSPQFTNGLMLKPPPSEHVRRQQPPTTATHHQNLPRPPTTKPPVLVPQPPTSYTSTNISYNVTTSLQNKQQQQQQQSSSPPTLDTSRTTTTSCTPLSKQHIDSHKTTLDHSSNESMKNSTLPVHSATTTTLIDPRIAVKHDNNVHQHNAAMVVKPGQQQQQESLSTSHNAVSNDAMNDTLSNSKSDRVASAQNGLTNSVQTTTNTATDISQKKSSSDTGTYTPPPISPPSPPPKQQTSWLMDGPSSNILSLSSRGNKTNNKQLLSSASVGLEKKELNVSMTEAASVITSQFLQHSRDEMTGSGGGGGQVVGRGNEQTTAVSLQTARALPLSLSRELHLPIIQGTIPMTTSRLPTSLQPAQITTKLEGAHPSQQIFDKRSISAQNLVARRASVTTNGSSYPEIFHTARRFSETTERGLKQALAG